MGESEGVSEHPGGGGRHGVQTGHLEGEGGGVGGGAKVPYCRGHKSTPSQESNTLSQVSCATDISIVDELEEGEGEEEVRGRRGREEGEGRQSSEGRGSCRTLSSLSGGKSVVLDLSSPDDQEKVPLELGKTLLCLIWLISGFFATTLSLALTHDRVPDSSPLPDLLLDAVQYQEWGLAASEVLLMVCVLTALLVVVAHTHRTVLLRRIWLVLGLLYYYRALTMAVTVLPRPDPTYTCRPKAEEGLTAVLVLRRVLTIVSGGGLSINGRHVYCGDYIFSGHTMTLVLAHLVTCGYSPPSWRPLHWLSLLASSTGVLLLLISRGHYTIDVLLAYYVTTRLWRLYHAVACTTYFREEGEHNPLSGMLWWPAVRFMERRVPSPLPRHYSLPIPKVLSRRIFGPKTDQDPS